MLDFTKGKTKVGIFGLGESNLGVIDYLKSKNYDFSLTVRSDKELGSDTCGSRCFIGDRALCDIDEDILFLSPSVRRDRAELIEAKRRGVILSSDAELFFEIDRGTHFAVTGSDGKSTTTYLISEMLNASHYPSLPMGNYGESLSRHIGEGLYAAAELSSFQLMHLSPRVKRAVITNVTKNHLNWHKDLDEYINAKMNVTENAEDVIADMDSAMLSSAIRGSPLFAAIGASRSISDLMRVCHAEHYVTTDGETLFLDGEEYLSLKYVKRREAFNVRNYMLAVAATIGFTDRDAACEVITGFSGLPHRSQTVGIRDGIRYVNSSIDSTPERTLSTLSALGTNTAVIIGGMGKGISLEGIARELPRLTAGAALMGDVGRELYGLLSSHPTYRAELTDSMEDAVDWCRSILADGGTVVLSPAATSFDRYRNFKERGEHFKNIVKEKYLT